MCKERERDESESHRCTLCLEVLCVFDSLTSMYYTIPPIFLDSHFDVRSKFDFIASNSHNFSFPIFSLYSSSRFMWWSNNNKNQMHFVCFKKKKTGHKQRQRIKSNISCWIERRMNLFRLRIIDATKSEPKRKDTTLFLYDALAFIRWRKSKGISALIYVFDVCLLYSEMLLAAISM